MNCLIWILLILGCSGNNRCTWRNCNGNNCGRGMCCGRNNDCGRDRDRDRNNGCGRDRDCDRSDGCGRNDGCDRDNCFGRGNMPGDCGCQEGHTPIMPVMPCACDGQGQEERGQACDTNMTPPSWQDYPVLPRRESCDCQD